MTTKNDGGPAFPMFAVTNEYGRRIHEQEYGMTLRDYFAAKAMAMTCTVGTPTTIAAENAYRMADAMLAAREK